MVNVLLMPLRSVPALGSFAIGWLLLMMCEECLYFDVHCLNSPSVIADCFLLPFKEYEDFVAVNNLDIFDDVVSFSGDSTQGSSGWVAWGCVGCGSSGCGVEQSISICVHISTFNLCDLEVIFTHLVGMDQWTNIKRSLIINITPLLQPSINW